MAPSGTSDERRDGQPGTRADLEALPDDVVGELIDGRLFVSPQPSFVHASVVDGVYDTLAGPFVEGQGGPGGWWILRSPRLRLQDEGEIVPDLAGWRKERVPNPNALLTTVPDWVCEVRPPSNWRLDLRVKRPFYARVGVPFMWIVDPGANTLFISRNVGGGWTELDAYEDDERAPVAPFEAIEVDLKRWWGR